MEENPRERYFGLKEVRDLVVDIEDDSHRKDQTNGEKKRGDEGADDVPIHPTQPRAIGLLRWERSGTIDLFLKLFLLEVFSDILGCRAHSVRRKKSLEAVVELAHHLILPLGEVASKDMFARFTYQTQIEGKVVDRCDL